jgi:hypothetical protein
MKRPASLVVGILLLLLAKDEYFAGKGNNLI